MWEKKFGSKTAFNKKEFEYRKCVAAWLDQDDPKQDPQWDSVVRNFTQGRIGYEILNPGEPLKAPFAGGLLTKFPEGHKARVTKTFERNRVEFLRAANAVLSSQKNELRSTLPAEEKCPKRKPLPPKEKPAGELIKPKPKQPDEKPKPSGEFAKPKPKPPGGSPKPKPKLPGESPKPKVQPVASPEISAEIAQLIKGFNINAFRPKTNIQAVEDAEMVELAERKRTAELAMAAAASASQEAQASANVAAVKSAVAAIEAVLPSASISPRTAKNKLQVGSEGLAKKLERLAEEAAVSSAVPSGSRRTSAERREREKEEKKAPSAIDNVYPKYTDALIAYTPARDEKTGKLDLIPVAKRTDRAPDDKFVLTYKTLKSLIENKTQSFVKQVHRNLTMLMKWQLQKYDDLIEKKAGSESKLAEYQERAVEGKEAKKQRKERVKAGDEEDVDPDEEYVIALIQKRNLLNDKIIPKGQLKWSIDALQERLLNAISNKKRGIMSIKGDARKSVRDQLLRTIYSLSVNIARFKEGENLILTGPAGSGKTTVADVIGFVYSQIGIMPTKYFAEVPITGIVSPFVNKTAITTQRKIIGSPWRYDLFR